MGKKFKEPQKSLIPQADPKVEKFVNYIMRDGKKNTAKAIYHKCMAEIRANGHMNPRVVFDNAIENASPAMMIKSQRVGGSVYQVPIEVKPARRFFFACKWILEAARSKKGVPMYKKLAEEMLAAYSGQGYAVKKREEAQRMADANRAFAYMAKYVR